MMLTDEVIKDLDMNKIFSHINLALRDAPELLYMSKAYVPTQASTSAPIMKNSNDYQEDPFTKRIFDSRSRESAIDRHSRARKTS